MEKKGYSPLTPTPELELHHEMHFCVILCKHFFKGLYFEEMFLVARPFSTTPLKYKGNSDKDSDTIFFTKN